MLQMEKYVLHLQVIDKLLVTLNKAYRCKKL